MHSSTGRSEQIDPSARVLDFGNGLPGTAGGSAVRVISAIACLLHLTTMYRDATNAFIVINPFMPYSAVERFTSATRHRLADKSMTS